MKNKENCTSVLDFLNQIKEELLKNYKEITLADCLKQITEELLKEDKRVRSGLDFLNQINNELLKDGDKNNSNKSLERDLKSENVSCKCNKCDEFDDYNCNIDKNEECEFDDEEDLENPYTEIANEVADIVYNKNIAYGNSAESSGKILEILFPNGIPVDKYNKVLLIARILDKISRICNDENAFGENPFKDIIGYCLVSIVNDNK